MRQKKYAAMQVKACLLTILCLLSANSIWAAKLYEIEVDKVKLYKGPSEKRSVVDSFYQASNIEILKQQGSWAQISFKNADKVVVGWVLKNQLSVARSSQVAAKLSDNSNTAVKEPKDSDAFFSENDFGAKVIGYDLDCVNVADTQYISGCVANFDLDVKGPVEGDSVTIMCKAEFEMGFETLKSKLTWEQKVIRTPLKKGIGAVRVHLAVIPLLEKQVINITMQSHQCRLESVLTPPS